MATLKERLRDTLATFDGACKLLDGQGSGKEYLLSSYLVQGSMKSYKSWEVDLQDGYKQQMKILNNELYDSAKDTIKLQKETTNYVVLCDEIKLPEFNFTRKSLEAVDKNDIDEELHQRVHLLLEENKNADTFKSAQIIGGEERSSALQVAPEASYRALFIHEFQYRARLRLKMQLLEKIRDMVSADQALWNERNREVSLFLNDRLVKMMDAVKQITLELEDGSDVDVEMT
ncbi:hypothetical protein DIURU_001974 [Diutina rugosa]|uniref:Uncharacterized protein n=1 Tax=Diutina rugosa TaxID=5481 RepID=A0A642URN2_DIURU|nr:uncharacterized protein DIURU_001974 [Diutina rugosa]KAA8904022.1 hypothetical protein DIURU_001974 [Diutina rugosa]